MASRITAIGIATINNGALTLSSSKWLSKRKTIASKLSKIAKEIFISLILKKNILIRVRHERTSMGTNASYIECF